MSECNALPSELQITFGTPDVSDEPIIELLGSGRVRIEFPAGWDDARVMAWANGPGNEQLVALAVPGVGLDVDVSFAAGGG